MLKSGRPWSDPIFAAVVWGRGVYFARDASYSLQKPYAKPNSEGWQHLFVCRLVVGEYCLGKNGQLRPDMRKGDLPFDSFVNDLSNPSIFVATDDAQACTLTGQNSSLQSCIFDVTHDASSLMFSCTDPEYLVRLKQP